MCGISGAIGCKLDQGIIEKMLLTMRRRGPDGNGIYSGKETVLLHSRLAVVDPAGGAQPMHLYFSGEHYIIVYNGELYNTQDIRSELINLGHCFSGHSDTEVLLHAYAQWKTDVLNKLNGIYAFAIWHEKEKRLFIARDRMGVKPFFYCLQQGAFVFASEIKTILASGFISPKLDKEGIMQLILLGPGRKLGSGVLKNILELEPGCYGEFAGGRLHVKRYWQMQDREHCESFEDTAEHVRWLVKDAICRQMVSDVPIGTFLSGGLDSSLITAICAKNMSGKLPTFSVDYENNTQFFIPGKFQPESDDNYIHIMEQTYKTEHRYTVLTPEDLINALEASTVARDLPGMADVDFSLLAFCGNISQHVKVALSGECADEIFGGYPWYRDPEVRALSGFPWAQNTAFRASMLYNNEKQSYEYVNQCYQDTIKKADILPGSADEDRRVKEMVNLNVHWFMQTLLDRKDRMSMYHGLEVRVPFCDHRIAEYLYSVPWAFKDHGGREKGLLRKAMEGVLPDKVLYRKKSPYPKTFDPKYEHLVVNLMKELLKSKDSALFEIVRKDRLNEIMDGEMEWPWYGQLMRRPQTIAYFLQMDLWLKNYHVNIVD